MLHGYTFFTTLIAGEDSNFEMEIVREVVIYRKILVFTYIWFRTIHHNLVLTATLYSHTRPSKSHNEWSSRLP